MRKTFVNYDKANDYLKLCNIARRAVEGDIKYYQTDPFTTYEVVKTSFDRWTNFKAVIFRKNDEYIVAFLGTDIKNIFDIATNGAMAFGVKPKQFEKAEEFVADMISKFNIHLDKLTAIGNSEGGSEAIHIKGTFGVKEVYTYNPYIPNLDIYDYQNLQSNIYNFRTSGDVVSKAGESVGEDFIVPLKAGVEARFGSLSIPTWHRIENMGDCTEAEPVFFYELRHPEFKNKIRKGVLKSYEIEDIPQDMYILFDADINDRLKNHAVVNEVRPFGYSLTGRPNCAGTYRVSGYTRDDGTKVSSYYRTCGAKHLNA